MSRSLAVLLGAVWGGGSIGCASAMLVESDRAMEKRVRAATAPYSPGCETFHGLPTAAEFEAITARNTPVVFRDAWLAFGPRVRRWADREYLVSELGHLVNPTSLFDLDRKKDHGDRFSTRAVLSKRTGTYSLILPYKEDWTIKKLVEHDWNGGGARDRVMAFAEQADSFNVDEWCKNPEPGQPCEDPVTVPELHQDVELAPFLMDSYADLVHFNLWLGKIPDAPDGAHPGREHNATGTAPKARFIKEATLHHDPNDNLLLMLAGTKTVYMYGDNDNDNVYYQSMPQFDRNDPFDPELRLAEPRIEGDAHVERQNFSPFNPLKPDYELLPRARAAKLKKCTLLPGDMLYMPQLTWHNVVSTPQEGTELNIAANMWFTAKCGSTSPYHRVSMAACGMFRKEFDDADNREWVDDQLPQPEDEGGYADERSADDDDDE